MEADERLNRLFHPYQQVRAAAQRKTVVIGDTKKYFEVAPYGLQYLTMLRWTWINLRIVGTCFWPYVNHAKHF